MMPAKARDLSGIGGVLSNARRVLGLSQDKLSEKSRISIRHISKIENGDADPSWSTLCKLLEVLRIDANLLFNLNPDIDLDDKIKNELTSIFDSCNKPNKLRLIRIAKCLADEDFGT
jgi:transcriptional regulator with XRE-family HTH domain